MRLKLNYRGDTIVEVLLAIAVVSAVLGGAYISARSSLNATRMAQERSEATKYAEQQLERLKAAPPNVFSGSDLFCLHITSPPDNKLEKKDVPAVGVFGTYPVECKLSDSQRYHASIERSTDNKNFQLTILWDRSGGGEQQRIDMFYRTYQ